MNNTITTTLRKVSLLVYCFLFIGIVSFGQQTDNWYFGSPGVTGKGLRIDFSSGAPVVSENYPLITLEGSSSISDASGTPLFYTDGTKIWDASTNTTFATGLLGGASSTQSAIVMPKPGATNQWLVFTSGETTGPTGTNGIHYYTVSGTPGAFTISGATNLAAANTVGEGLFIIGSTKAGSSFWVIARDKGNTGVVRAWDVTNAGAVNATAVTSTLSNTGWTQTNYTSNIGTIKSNTCQTQLAFTYLSGDIDLTNFNTATGVVVANTARRITIASSGGNSGSYGIEFSPNDAYLYATNLSGNTLIRHDIVANTTNATFGATSYPAGQLQLGPDGKIYMGIQGDLASGPGYLGVITNPGAAGATFSATGLQVTPQPSTNGFAYWGLPTFPKSLVVSTPTLSPGDVTRCTNIGVPVSYVFAGSVSSQLWSVSPATGWSYTTGSATSASPTITFTTAGTYTVSVDITDACSRHYIEDMEITVIPPKVPAGAITCGTSSITMTATGTVPADYPKYVWYDAAVGGNVYGIGTPVTWNNPDNASSPSSVWVEVASSASTSSAVTNVVGPDPDWLFGSSYQHNTRFHVLADHVRLNSFQMYGANWPGACPGVTNVSFTIEIRNASNVIVFQKPYSSTITCGGFTTIPVTADLVKGNNYTISLLSFTSNASSWQQVPNTDFPGTVAGVATVIGPVSNYTTLGNLSFTSNNFTIVPECPNRVKVDRLCSLPVEMISFTGTNKGTFNVLEWTTSSEINNDYFDVQYSTDGINFVTIGRVDGHGNSSVIRHYQFSHYGIQDGLGYYRLLQTDFDSQATLSQMIKIETSSLDNDLFVVSPNPSTESFGISFRTLSGGEISVFDVLGKVLLVQSVGAGIEKIEIGAAFSKGAYIVRYTGTSGSSSQLIIKE